MDPDKQISDEQLDSLLRQVEIPSDLKDKLRTISDRHPVATRHDFRKAAKPKRMYPSFLSVVLAASLIGLASFITWEFWPPADIAVQPIADRTIADKPDSQNEIDPDATAETQNSVRNKRIIELENRMLEIENQSLLARLQQLEAPIETPLDRVESESIILAIAEQTSIAFGGSERQVAKEMARLIERYPDSEGAQIAQDFIYQLQN